MKKIYTVLIFGISMFLVNNLATAQLLNLWIDGDRVVYDIQHPKYFHPHLSYFFDKDYEQQDDMISALDYAEINEWRWAYYADMIPLRVSVFGSLIPNAFNMATGINTNRFFMYTSEMPSFMGPSETSYFTHGRTGDEDGLATGAIIGAQINPLPGSMVLAQRYLDFGTPLNSVDTQRPPHQFYALPRSDYPPPYYNVGTESQDHWMEFDRSTGSYMYNDDLNYTAEDVPFVLQDFEGKPRPCGAWTVYDGPAVAELGELDISPWSNANLVNPDSKYYLPIAILSTKGFKANWIDRKSIRIGPDPGGKAYKRRQHLKDVDGDGDKDLILYFKISETGIWPGDKVWGFYAETHQGKGYIFMDYIETSAVDDLKSIAAFEEEFAFEAEVYPNPFSRETNIRFHLPEAGHVILKVYNILGQEILSLANTPYEEGTHTLQWDGTDMSGNEAPGGIYIYRIQVGDNVLTDRIQLIR